MRVVFLGEDSFSARVLNSLINNNIQILMVLTPWYDNFIYKRLEALTRKCNIPYLREKDINSIKVVDKIKCLNPDIIVTAHFEKLLKKELIEIPHKGCINLHPSLLPRYRGMAPQHWPIINGDTETGVTVHYIEEDVDTGNIILQKKLLISPDVYVHELQMQMLPIYETIVVEAINLIANGFVGIKQDLSKGSIYGKFKSKQAEITSNKTKMYAYNLIRAISKPYMGAYYEKYRIWKAHLPGSEEDLLMSEHPEIGFYIKEEGNALLRLDDGVLIIDDYQLI